MAAKDEPPQSVRTFHTDMVKKLDELFPVEQGSWTKTRNEVQMKDLLTASDLGKVTNMLELFIKLMEKGKIKYGRYTTICDILKYYNADAGEIIERYTGLIKEALNTGVPTLIINNKLYSLTKGKPAILKCGITSTTVIRNVQWKRKRKGEVSFRDIQKDNKNFSGGSIDSPSLTIDMASEEDNGAIYLCNATNDAGTGQSDEIHVTITQPETDAAAGDALKKTVREMLENTMKEAEDQINKFVEPLGGIEDFKITTDRDTRVITVQFIVKNGMKKHKECLQKQIQHILGFKERTFNFEIIISCIIVSFDITGVTHPLDESALALAERFSTGLEDGSIFLTDETGNPLQIQQNSLKIKMKKTADAAVDVSLPMVSIDQAAYIGATGEIAILKSRLLTSTPITSVAWFRIENEDKTEHVIEIDNEKYFGGSIESPSLVIDDIKVDDAGRYVCHAANRFGGGKSFATCLCVFNSENSETGFAAIQAETSLKDSQSEVSSEKTSDDDSVTQTFTENESHDKFLTSAVAGGHTNTEKLLLEKGRDHYDVPFQGLAAEDNPPSEVLKIHSETVEKLGKLFSIKDRQWRIICEQVKMKALLSDSDLRDGTNMKGLFIALMKRNKIDYGEYNQIREIIGDQDVVATK
ncbi:uncharacterized protein LOC110453773 [Mizuhopecten yessoensis]|uniref:uncharacterized protein LOC110453773 n=1 Tax=Mizuhopecten yessoensis TaxID=6573 RepID=UPI000B459037|nr:uncharacterized protein LOC110453773 [Mizuhopecten yessoensis]